MRLSCGVLVLALSACYASHSAPEADAGRRRDAALARADASPRDAEPDVRGADAGDGAVACRAIDRVVEVRVDRAIRARDGARTLLVVGRFGGGNPLEVFAVDAGADQPEVRRLFEVPDAAGGRLLAAALRGERLALALSYGERAPELMLLDVARGVVQWRSALDETLGLSLNALVWLGLTADGTLLSAVELFTSQPSSVRVRMRDEAGRILVSSLNERQPQDGLAAPLLALARASATDPSLRATFAATVGELAVERTTMRAQPGQAPVSTLEIDRGRVLEVSARELRIDGMPIGTGPEGVAGTYGSPSFAVHDDAVVIATATDGGLFWTTVEAGALEWRSAATPWLAGSPASFADEDDRGTFLVDPPLGPRQGELRYVGLHCPR